LRQEERAALSAAAGTPFLREPWLAAIEASERIGPLSNWKPRHLVLRDASSGELRAFAPNWLRDASNSAGEFLWHESIEIAAMRMGAAPGPRAVCCVPWTPVAGRRWITLGDEEGRPPLLRGIAAALCDWQERDGLASVHVLLCAEDEAAALQEAGFLLRRDIHLVWEDLGYGDWEGWLRALRARRRNQAQRELRGVAEAGIELDYVPGDAAPDAWFPLLHRYWEGTATRHGMPCAPFDRRFFEEIAARMRGAVLFGVARRRGAPAGQDPVGLTFNVRDGDRLFGRFWGAKEEVPFLHLGLAYHGAIRHCLGNGLRRYDPGYGGDFKARRGFEPLLVPTLHRYRDGRLHRAVEKWAAREREAVRARAGEMRDRGAIKVSGPSGGPAGGARGADDDDAAPEPGSSPPATAHSPAHAGSRDRGR
jgi:predicted N-acyltransferase